jgi:hypothetical protein
VIVPAPATDSVTVKLYTGIKVAATDVAAVMDTVQVPVPEQPPPDQPEKTDPLFAKAVKATAFPES